MSYYDNEPTETQSDAQVTNEQIAPDPLEQAETTEGDEPVALVRKYAS